MPDYTYYELSTGKIKNTVQATNKKSVPPVDGMGVIVGAIDGSLKMYDLDTKAVVDRPANPSVIPTTATGGDTITIDNIPSNSYFKLIQNNDVMLEHPVDIGIVNLAFGHTGNFTIVIESFPEVDKSVDITVN